MHLFGCEREQCLPGTAELTEAGKYDTDSFLDSHVRIQSQSHLAMPEIAGRDADAQVAAKCLTVLGIVHACTNDAELELADTALHAQQQPIVRPARVIDAVRIDHLGADQPTELKQVMPVAAI